MHEYPLSAVVGMDDLKLALLVNAVSPAIGGVLVRGEKGTAKSTVVRALAELLPPVTAVAGCRFSCDPAAPDPDCPDGPHPPDAGTSTRPARLAELPVGATEDRLTGSLDIERALSEGAARYQPGLLAAAHRGLLYVDEVNLLHDHLVDLLLDAAALGTSYVERDGVSVTHAARFLLVGTMNPEEGELRPQLLDRFGLTVQVEATRDLAERAEVVRRRLAYEEDPAGFAAHWAEETRRLTRRIADARRRLPGVSLPAAALRQVCAVCGGFGVDGLRADLVTARTAIALAAWSGRDEVTTDDIRAAARLALPHRRRRDPFDAPGLDPRALDEALEKAQAETGSPGEGPGEPAGGTPRGPGGDGDGPDPDGPGPGGHPLPGGPESPGGGPTGAAAAGSAADGADSSAGPLPERADGEMSPPGQPGSAQAGRPRPGGAGDGPGGGSGADAAKLRVASAGRPFRPRLFTVPGVGAGAPGRRSAAQGSQGRVTGSRLPAGRIRALHLPATVRAAAPHQPGRGRRPGSPGIRLSRADLREAVRTGREGNLVLFVVDASGSMAARQRMRAVKGAVLSLLLDAYQRRDKVGMITFRGTGAEVVLPPTASVDAAARRLASLPAGGRTPLAAGLWRAAEVLRAERMRDPRRRPLLVVVTDGRATHGDADAVARAAALVRVQGPRAGRGTRGLGPSGDQASVASVVVDCEEGPVRLGLAAGLAAVLGGDLVRLGELGAGAAGGAGGADGLARLVRDSRRGAA
jgi:magnesium chelatase subunit D